MSSANKIIFYHLPPIIWAGLIYFASSLPGGKVPLIEGMDKVAHFGVYGIFCWLLHRSLQNNNLEIIKKYSIIISIILTSLYGFGDELHQSFVPQRFSDVGDLIADILGAIAYCLVYISIKKNKKTI